MKFLSRRCIKTPPSKQRLTWSFYHSELDIFSAVNSFFWYWYRNRTNSGSVIPHCEEFFRLSVVFRLILFPMKNFVKSKWINVKMIWFYYFTANQVLWKEQCSAVVWMAVCSGWAWFFLSMDFYQPLACCLHFCLGMSLELASLCGPGCSLHCPVHSVLYGLSLCFVLVKSSIIFGFRCVWLFFLYH